MTKAQIVSQIKNNIEKSSKFSKSNITLQLVSEIVNNFIEIIKQEIKEGKRVELRGFGTFEIKIRKSKKALNPRTKERVFVEEHAIPFFRAGRDFKKEVKSIYKKNKK